jgi:hypothetical protein
VQHQQLPVHLWTLQLPRCNNDLYVSPNYHLLLIL